MSTEWDREEGVTVANAKLLTGPQVKALRDAVRGALRYSPARRHGYNVKTILALLRRGLVAHARDGLHPITDAGRHALFEATGESGSAGDGSQP